MDILSLLSSQQAVSGEQIASRLGISRAAVHKRILKLRKQGYSIVGRKNYGYSLISRPDLLTPEEIRVHLKPSCAMGRNIYYFPLTESTQITAKELASCGASEGSVVIAEEQSAGYGRMQRKWASPKGGIWLSLILRPVLQPDAVVHITFIMSMALCRASAPRLEQCILFGGRPPSSLA